MVSSSAVVFHRLRRSSLSSSSPWVMALWARTRRSTKRQLCRRQSRPQRPWLRRPRFLARPQWFPCCPPGLHWAVPFSASYAWTSHAEFSPVMDDSAVEYSLAVGDLLMPEKSSRLTLVRASEGMPRNVDGRSTPPTARTFLAADVIPMAHPRPLLCRIHHPRAACRLPRCVPGRGSPPQPRRHLAGDKDDPVRRGDSVELEELIPSWLAEAVLPEQCYGLRWSMLSVGLCNAP